MTTKITAFLNQSYGNSDKLEFTMLDGYTNIFFEEIGGHSYVGFSNDTSDRFVPILVRANSVRRIEISTSKDLTFRNDIKADFIKEVLELMRKGRKIDAIRKVRTALDLGLASAKQFVEDLDNIAVLRYADDEVPF
jgi:protein gp37